MTRSSDYISRDEDRTPEGEADQKLKAVSKPNPADLVSAEQPLISELITYLGWALEEVNEHSAEYHHVTSAIAMDKAQECLSRAYARAAQSQASTLSTEQSWPEDVVKACMVAYWGTDVQCVLNSGRSEQDKARLLIQVILSTARAALSRGQKEDKDGL